MTTCSYGPKHRIPFHPYRTRNPEQPERGWVHILDPRIGCVQAAVGKKHTGNQRRVDTMITAPCLIVVLEDGRGDAAYRGIPRCAVAVGIADDQVGRGVQV